LGQLWQLRLQEYELKIKALASLLNKELLEDEANRKGLSTDALLEQLVDRNLPRPSASEIEAYYATHKAEFNNRPFQEVRPQAEELRTLETRKKAREDYIDKLREKREYPFF